MQELKGKCKKCLGCNRLEDPEFIGVYGCEYATSKQLTLEEIQEELSKDESSNK